MDTLEIQKVVREVMTEEANARKVKSVSLFGSFLHGNTKPDSDVDLLFEMQKPMSLFEIGGLQYRLQEKLGREVDFIEKDSLDKYIKEDVLAEAKKIYEH